MWEEEHTLRKYFYQNYLIDKLMWEGRPSPPGMMLPIVRDIGCCVRAG